MRIRHTRGLAAGELVAAIAGALVICPAASAQVYWASEGGTTISRDTIPGGTISDPNFITGATAPTGVAINGTHIYWSHAGGTSGSIGRAELDGTTGLSQTFIDAEVTSAPGGVALDAGRVYWTHVVTPMMGSPSGQVGRASLAAFGANPSFVQTGNTTPCGVASDGDDEFWANGGSPGSIGSAHGNETPNQSLITGTSDPCGVARAGNFVYWTNQGDGSIGRAGNDGSNPDPDFVDTGSGTPCGLAVDGQHIYWSDPATDTIGRVDLDGTSNFDDDFIASAGSDPCGVAVTPTQEATPAMHAFAPTPVGSQSDIQSFFVANTASSVLDVTSAQLVGANPEGFEITGDGCTPNRTSPGLGCLVNVRFSPSGEGIFSATLEITSNASNSPTDISLSGTGVTPPLPPEPEAEPAADTEPPDTTISAGPPAKTKKRNASFEFGSSESGSSFECKLDDAAFEPCASPQDYRVGKGNHSFEVRATDAAGNTDPTPAARSWRVKKKKKKS